MTGTDRDPSGAAAPRIARTPLLTASMDGTRPVTRVEVYRIEMPPGLPSGMHLHPCPVVGLVVAGSVLFQVEGEAPRVLGPGDAFHEPAGARVAHFDAGPEGATFVAHYLLGPGEHELITMLA